MSADRGGTYRIPLQEAGEQLLVTRVDDEEGAFISLENDEEVFDLVGDDFFVTLSIENAARLGELLRVLTA